MCKTQLLVSVNRHIYVLISHSNNLHRVSNCGIHMAVEVATARKVLEKRRRLGCIRLQRLVAIEQLRKQGAAIESGSVKEQGIRPCVGLSALS